MDLCDDFAARLRGNRLTRRDTLWLFGASTAVVAGLQGCAASPVTGETIVVGLSEEQERRVDEQQSPHQFSQDLGPVQDARLNDYVVGVGRSLHGNSHRKEMPYSYRVLNANYVNAYTFPAGAVGVTRGIMTELDDESQLAALLGHELGHVNARHAAQRQGQAMIAQAVVVGIGVAASDSQWGALAGLGSQIGASALLSSYSRDNEREADALGQEYMVRSGYPATGMTGLHQMLVDQQKEEPSLLATMFSSHPMSSERRDTARQLAETKYATSAKAPVQRERYMDHTAGLRRIKPTIDACKNGETAMSRKAYTDAQGQFASAIKHTPQDYAANLRMAQCLQAQGNTKEAQRYARAAKTIYPQEAQARKLSGVLALSAKEPALAYEELDAFDRLLPGDPGVIFLKAVSLEGMGDKPRAARHYNAYLRLAKDGDAAKYSASRLKAWGYTK
ncbi:M48 family metalloprotease [Schlegelella sp. S2-27]|uniref:M48 family metalloprotease n=1 Tax=Caldimonas mangrovi TaxID=2944811 RepID=A0ABT0YJB6_9BURK|nr:M48 family metalloprotease [Caldimonas mangrovi]MCM5678819.1 M48 family metalloprotease [Caldimonas mangrovi]